MTSNYQSKTWFITGSTGLVGSSIITKLLESEVNIIALVRDSSDEKKIKWLEDQGVKLVIGDILKPDTFKYHLGTSDIVLHTAAAVRQKSRTLTTMINVEGTRNILDAALEFKVPKLIHISTVGVYGRSVDDEITEQMESRPIGTYSSSKREAEKILLRYQNQLDIIIFRPPFIIGSLEFDRHVLPTLNKLLDRRVLPSIWRRNPEFGFVHARDIASAVMLAGSIANTESNIFNIQSFSISYRELVSYGEYIYNRKIILLPVPYSFLKIVGITIDVFLKLFGIKTSLSRRLSTFKKRWVFSTTKLETELNWVSQYNNKEILLRMLIEMNSDSIRSVKQVVEPSLVA